MDFHKPKKHERRKQFILGMVQSCIMDGKLVREFATSKDKYRMKKLGFKYNK